MNELIRIISKTLEQKNKIKKVATPHLNVNFFALKSMLNEANSSTNVQNSTWYFGFFFVSFICVVKNYTFINNPFFYFIL